MSTINEELNSLLADIDGSMCALLGDSESGMLLASAGGGLDLEIAAAGTTEFMRAKLNTMRALNLDDQLEDILVTLGSQSTSSGRCARIPRSSSTSRSIAPSRTWPSRTFA